MLIVSRAGANEIVAIFVILLCGGVPLPTVHKYKVSTIMRSFMKYHSFFFVWLSG